MLRKLADKIRVLIALVVWVVMDALSKPEPEIETMNNEQAILQAGDDRYTRGPSFHDDDRESCICCGKKFHPDKGEKDCGAMVCYRFARRFGKIREKNNARA